MSNNQREYRVWDESGDVLGTYDNPQDMRFEAKLARARCAEHICGTDGQEETPGKGDFKCGVLHPHGIFVQVVEGDDDVTQDYLTNGS